jgi:hypothetical protein
MCWMQDTHLESLQSNHAFTTTWQITHIGWSSHFGPHQSSVRAISHFPLDRLHTLAGHPILGLTRAQSALFPISHLTDYTHWLVIPFWASPELSPRYFTFPTWQQITHIGWSSHFGPHQSSVRAISHFPLDRLHTLAGREIFFPRILGTQCTYINQSEIAEIIRHRPHSIHSEQWPKAKLSSAPHSSYNLYCQCDKTDVNEFKSLNVCVNQSSCIQTISWMSLCVVESFEWARVNARSTQIQIQIKFINLDPRPSWVKYNLDDFD